MKRVGRRREEEKKRHNKGPSEDKKRKSEKEEKKKGEKAKAIPFRLHSTQISQTFFTLARPLVPCHLRPLAWHHHPPPHRQRVPLSLHLGDPHLHHSRYPVHRRSPSAREMRKSILFDWGLEPGAVERKTLRPHHRLRRRRFLGHHCLRPRLQGGCLISVNV